ncbi:MAG: class C sortase [Mogibacterium sp.]|nr:class C sortase [Mogibacterium sp.]
MGRWIRHNLLTVVMVTGMLVGVGLLLYPSVANYWNSFHQSRAIASYSEVISSMSRDDYKRIIEDARRYNGELAQTGMRWSMTDAQREEYEQTLVIPNTEVMAYISIPKFHVRAPIYHGTDEAVLQVAIGHIEGSSLPVGGPSTHCIVSGHRGLPSARLFTDIVKMKVGDTWTISVLNETLTYQVDQIRIVLPDDLSDLKIIEGQDLCTLVTCTPYGVNTHRLLVRGHRIPNADGTADLTADAIQIEPIYIAPFLAVPALLVLLVILLISTRRAKRIDPKAIQAIYLSRKGL